MSPAEGLKDILVAEGVVASGWTWTVGGLRDTAKSISFIDSGGRGGEVKVAIDYVNVQILVLGEKAVGGYTAAYAKADEIFAKLQGITTPHASFSRLVSCVAMGHINWLGKDSQDRPQFSLNFRLIATPENAGNRNY